MKQTQYYITLTLAAACVLLCIATIILGKSSQSAQLDMQKRQNEIQGELQQRRAEVNKGSMSDRVGGAILQDMAAASLKNSKVKDVLTKNGYNLSASPSPAAGSSSATPSRP